MNTEYSKFVKVVSQTNYRPNARVVLGLLLLPVFLWYNQYISNP